MYQPTNRYVPTNQPVCTNQPTVGGDNSELDYGMHNML